MNPEMFKKRYKQTRVYQHGIFSRSAVQNLLSDVTAENFNKHFKLEVPNHQFAYGDVDCSHTSIHIAGIPLIFFFNIQKKCYVMI